MTTFKNIIRSGKQAAFRAALLVCLISLLSQPATARESSMPMFDPEAGEIRITSDRMVMETEGNEAEFIGNVHAIQGETSVRSNRMKIFYKSGSEAGVQDKGVNEESIEKMEASGDVIIDFRDTTAEADTAVYTSEDGVLKLYGDPANLKSKESVITGSQIIMHRDTGNMEVKGKDDKRVEAVLKPASGSDRDESENQSTGPDE
ncbi:MAG: LptA/OstA family protein [Desulfosalsimonas sp.]